MYLRFIISPVVYYFYVRRKITKIRKEFCPSEPSFIFFTDAHWGANRKKSTYIIRRLLKETPIDKVFFGGDFMTHVEPTKDEAMKLAVKFMEDFSFVEQGFYCIYGNHDDNSYDQKNLKAILTKADLEKILISRLNNSSEHFSFNDAFTYYFDNIIEKCRYIVLNTANRYSSPQEISFIVSALNVPVGFKIIVLSHIMLEWNGRDYVTTNQTDFLFDLFDCYNNRVCKNDFCFTNARGRIVLLVGGHVHNDTLKYTTGGIPIIICNADCDKKACGCKHYEFHPKEQCVTVFCFNQQGELNIIRIGKESIRTHFESIILHE